MSFAFTKPIALSLGLILSVTGIYSSPLLADSGDATKKTGDLGFWEELAFWETIKNSKEPSEFEAYLATYPNGRFARLAEIRIKALKGQPAAEGEGSAEGTGVAGRDAVSVGESSASAVDTGTMPGNTFRDCDSCPLMVVVPAGTHLMGSDTGRADEKPRHEVRFARPFAIGVYEITLAEWDACLREGGCRISPESGADPRLPASNLSWDDARAYVAWLSKKTGQAYRLPSEAEWEYAASGGKTTAFWWGNESGKGNANCSDCGSEWDARGPAPVGSFASNPFGLFDTHGNLWEWTMDCMNGSYRGAPADGSAWLRGDCIARVLRGGSWNLASEYMRTTRRNHYDRDVRYYLHGFRVARSLP
ncbi:MAG: formylglycine-generating enzyme family protein [Chromatiaceae bacterium]